MRILFFTRYGRLGASSRVRALQHIPGLKALGWTCDVSPFFSDDYLRALYKGEARWTYVIRAFLTRLCALLRARRYDIVWIEKELLPYLPAWGERLLAALGVRLVADYDDALFHYYDRHRAATVRALLGKKIDIVMRCATLVTVGNCYLAGRAVNAGAQKVEILPTVVDHNRYYVTERRAGPVVVGWIGSPSTAGYLHLIQEPLAEMQRRHGICVRLIGSGPIRLEGVDCEILDWEESKEPILVASLDIGVMPLPDSPWERGKCGYKLIQYMACGRPVVASPVGVNTEIVRPTWNGFLATSSQEWKDALRRLIEDEGLRRRLGTNGRALVADAYSLHAQLPILEKLLAELVSS